MSHTPITSPALASHFMLHVLNVYVWGLGRKLDLFVQKQVVTGY